MTTLRPPRFCAFEENDERKDPVEELVKEYQWMQGATAPRCFQQVLGLVKECCSRLYVASKCEPLLKIEQAAPKTENLELKCKNGSDAIRAKVSLLADNVIQAEVHIKHPKTPGGVYRGVAQPDVQWKLQQLQDAGNQCARAACSLAQTSALLDKITQNQWSRQSGDLVLEAAKAAKTALVSGRTTLVVPRKRSLLELCHFPPTKKFQPQMPQDVLLSFYISSSRLVCACYQMQPKQTGAQSLSISVSECHLPWLADVLCLISQSINALESLIHSLETLKTSSQCAQ